MAVDMNLLIKAAKVYEAAESVEGMKPKEVYESHKKCAPGEFNMHKEGAAQLQQVIAKMARQKVANEPKLFPFNMTGRDLSGYNTNWYTNTHDPANNHGAMADLLPSLQHAGTQMNLDLDRAANNVGSAITGGMQRFGKGPGMRIGGLLGNVALGMRSPQLNTLQRYDTAGFNKYKNMFDKYQSGAAQPAEKPMPWSQARPAKELIQQGKPAAPAPATAPATRNIFGK